MPGTTPFVRQAGSPALSSRSGPVVGQRNDYKTSWELFFVLADVVIYAMGRRILHIEYVIAFGHVLQKLPPRLFSSDVFKKWDAGDHRRTWASKSVAVARILALAPALALGSGTASSMSAFVWLELCSSTQRHVRACCSAQL
jgi:hypothetical protein